MLERNIPKHLLKSASQVNPAGLQLKFQRDNNTAQTEFILNENHQGLPGYAHEGVIAMLMDEGMGWISRYGAEVKSVTARLEIEFHQLAKVGETLIMTAQITKNTQRLVEVAVQIKYPDGSLIASGICIQYVIDSYNTAD